MSEACTIVGMTDRHIIFLWPPFVFVNGNDWFAAINRIPKTIAAQAG